MSEFQITLAVLGLVFGGLATWSYRRDQAVQKMVDSEKRDREKDIEICHQRISKTRQEGDANSSNVLKEISVARSESGAAIAAVRSEFQERMHSSETKAETSLSRVHSRIDEIKRDMVTHDDANIHFKRIEDSLGNFFKTLNDNMINVATEVKTMSTSVTRIDERVKSLEKKSGDE